MVKKPLPIILPPSTIETQVLNNKYQVTSIKYQGKGKEKGGKR
jgi:hypothetical protein